MAFLPPEIYQHIFSFVWSPCELSALALVCSTFHELVTPLIYRTICCEPPTPVTLYDFLDRLAMLPALARHIVNLELGWNPGDVRDKSNSTETLLAQADAGARGFSVTAVEAFGHMNRLTILSLDGTLSSYEAFLDNCTLPSLKSLRASCSPHVQFFLQRHPRITSLDLHSQSEFSTIFTLPPGDPLIYFGAACDLIVEILLEYATRELADGAAIYARGKFRSYDEVWQAIGEWSTRTRRRLGWHLVNGFSLYFFSLIHGRDPPGNPNVDKVVLLGNQLTDARFTTVKDYLALCPRIHTIHLSPLNEAPRFYSFPDVCLSLGTAVLSLKTVVEPGGRAWHYDGEKWQEGGIVDCVLPSPFFLRIKKRAYS